MAFASSEAAMIGVEQVKQTELPNGLTIVTARFNDQYLLRPFRIYTIDGVTGRTEHIGEYTCTATAAHAHDASVRKLMADAGTERAS
jgi:hypothetical protein